MPTIKFVCLHRPNRSPSQRFRFEQYINILQAAGFNTSFSYLISEKDDRVFYAKGKYVGKFLILTRSFWKRFKEVYLDKPADIVFVQRECFMLGTAFFEKQFAKRSKLIFDFDDSIWLQNISDANKRFSFLKNAQKTSTIIQYASIIFAGNSFLKSYAIKFNANVHVVPTTIDTDLYVPKKIENKDIIKIGWSGSFTTICHFETAIPVLKRINQKYGDRVSFIVIGDANYTFDELGLKGMAWKSDSEVADLQQIDIGIMPLPNDEWSKGKCGLKGLQYMALGIPTIMSPVGVNIEIIQDGVNGFLAASDDEWFKKLSALIDSIELRQSIGAKGRETVDRNYSVRANANKYVSLLSELVGVS